MEQVIAHGFYLGAQYALIALGLTLIFALMNVLNFAHGQMYVLGGFITYTVYGQLGLPFVLALLASGVTLAVIGALMSVLRVKTCSVSNDEGSKGSFGVRNGVAVFEAGS